MGLTNYSEGDALTARRQLLRPLSAWDHPLPAREQPKWGFLPSGAHLSEATRGFKTRHSRFRMHQVLKSEHSQPDSDETADKTSSSAEQALVAMGGSAFDPLDLYSGDLDRAARAVRALYASWRLNNGANNLRLFLSGRLIDPSKVSEPCHSKVTILVWVWDEVTEFRILSFH